jgi:tripeptidyl-peptidase I
LDGIDGGVAPFFFDGFEQIGVESLLDMSIIMPLVYPQSAVLFQVDDLVALETTGGFGDTFLDALDASYCTFEGGDDPNLDPVYPDTFQDPEAEPGTGITYNGTTMCGTYKPTNVISVSYGLGENHFSYFYENRQCTEYLKLGLQGVTVVYASGDSGVSDRGSCIIPDDQPYNGDPGAFSPSFPASCPYLTSVGATQVRKTFQHFESCLKLFSHFVVQHR